MHVFDRLSAWWSSAPPARIRRLLLALYIATAAADAIGKALAATPAFNRAISSRVEGASAVEMREAARPSGNFEIFRTAARHLVDGMDLYAKYPEHHSDRFKYSPTFAFLFAPFAWLPWPLALFLWSSLNALVLFAAVERVLPGRTGLLAMLCLHLEVLRGMQNAQSNALMGALIILAFVLLEQGRSWRAALAVALGACVKVYPLAALTFAIAQRRAFSTGVRAACVGVGLALLPLLVTSPATLVRQYESWRAVESLDLPERWFSSMALLHHMTQAPSPNWPIQLAGTVLLVLPLALRRERWPEERFRFLYLCSVLLFVVLFNHQAERAAYVIAFTGSTIWFFGSPRAGWRTAMWTLAFVSIPLITTLVPGAWLRTPTAVLYRLALPTLAIWLAIQWELWRKEKA